ncbi:MAG: universal stress protein [Deltaproteobacteria bacterium]|nr:universal stress protein [Deltaproteobacteria bacterium]
MYQKILVPLDGSAFAECSLDQVINLSQMGSIGEVILLNVLDPIMWCREGRDFVAFRNFQFTQAEKYLERIKARLGSEGIRVRSDISEGGMPASSIVQYAKENGVDLIVIASHGHTGMKKLMLGSVALEVLHDSHVPVLLIRP